MAKPFRYTQDILKVVADGGHYTADELYKILRKNNPLIHKGSLYRNLDHLVEQDQLMKIEGLKKAAIYEKMKPPHSHVFCHKSGEIIDITVDIPIPDHAVPHGFHIEQAHVVLTGYFGGAACKTKR